MDNSIIKFRCWNVEKRIMHDIAFPTWNGSIEVWMDNKPQTETEYLTNGPADEGVLMQFTGLKDKNGKEIYCGDVIKCVNGEKDIPNDIIEFDKGYFGLKYRKIPIDTWFRYTSDGMINFGEIIVLGNIYEHLELLK